MNILICTGKFGMGHISAAEAIKENLLIKYPNSNIIIVDCIEYMFPFISKIIYRTFNFLVEKVSKVYNFFNAIASKQTNVPLKSVIIKRIETLLEENNIDVIISTLPICSQYLSRYKNTTKSTIPLYTFITDVYFNNEWIAKNIDKYFVASNETKEELMKKGIEEEKVIVSGIPVKNAFKVNNETAYKTKIENKNNIKRILIMGGGLGLIPRVDDLIKKLTDVSNIKITIISGNNKNLEEELKRKYPNIEVLGYVNNVDKYLKESDLIVTKAGGITVFEAINTTTPICVIKPFLSQELGNAKFLEQKEIGRVIWNNKINVSKNIIELLNDNKELNQMKYNMQLIKNTFSPIFLDDIRGEKICCL